MIVGPKVETKESRGKRYHAKERFKQGEEGSEWYFEEVDIPVAPANMILVRILVAKTEDESRLAKILRETTIRQGEPGWNCVSWVKEALERLEKDGKVLGTSMTDWGKVRDTAMDYCQKKKDEHRFDDKGSFDMRRVATYDLIESKETIP